jgi:hypothetical protein
MAESWLKYTPTSGTASGVVTYTTDFLYGRKARSTTSTIVSTAGSPTISKNVTVKQYGYGVYSYINNTNINSVGQIITVNVGCTVTSATFNFDVNFKKIEITQVDTSSFPLTLNFPSSNSWTGKVSGSGTWTNNNDIVGDPGAVQRYTTSLICTFSQNTGASRSGKFRVRGYYNTTESDVNGGAGVDTYKEFYLVVRQAEMTEYSVTVGSIAPLSGEGDNTTWKLPLIQSNPNPRTYISGNLDVIRSDGDFDICSVNGTIIGEIQSLQILTSTGEPYMKNPDLLTGEISNVNLSGTSQTSGYVCTGVSQKII